MNGLLLKLKIIEITNMIYKLTIEFTALADARAVQDYVNRNYNDNEVLWNAISEYHEKRI